MSTVIRLVAEPDDIDDDVRETLDAMDSQAFANAYHKPGSYWWIAYDGETPVGYCGLTPYPDYGVAFLCRVAVVESHRGQGLQRRFIAKAEQMAKRDGIAAVVTYTANDNLHSANNFMRRGYLMYKPPYEYGIPGALYLRKPMGRK
jgi:GNAT superfamily N-acetyltransferase